jgi:DGQHR domain-containing protein
MNTSASSLPVANVMTSPIHQDLTLALFKSTEGIEQLGITSYEGVISFKDLANHFQIEENSDVLSEDMKRQRDVDNARINALKAYWKTSKGTVFPNMTIFANHIDIINQHEIIPGRFVLTATLPALADRFICDGQGRTTFIKWLLAQEHASNYDNHTVSFKLLITHTSTLSEPSAVKMVRQVFADYHVRLKKPNKSISRHFNTSGALDSLINDLMDVEANGLVRHRIALHGRIRQGHLWTYDQFCSMIQKFLKLTPVNAEKHLADVENYELSFELCKQFIQRVFNLLPLDMLDNSEHFNEVHEQCIFTKAIFANALAYVGRSLLDEMLADEKISWNKMTHFDMPIENKYDKFWQKNRITMDDNGSVKIIKATDRRIAALLCRQYKIYPCAELIV